MMGEAFYDGINITPEESVKHLSVPVEESLRPEWVLVGVACTTVRKL